MAGIAEVGLLTYNGFRFPPAISLRIDAQPIQGKGGRTTKYTKYILRVEFLLHPGVDDGTNIPAAPAPIVGTPTDPYLESGMQNWRSRILKQGATLVISQKGFGETQLGFSQRDIAYGPIPTLLHMEPIGSNKVFSVVWQCEFHVVDTCIGLNRGILDTTSTYNWTINERGRTTRTISGSIEVVNNRRAPIDPSIGLAAGSALVPLDSADTVRENILRDMDVPLGFRREIQDFSLSEDRRFLNFRIIDVELESRFPFPQGIVDIDASHQIRTRDLKVGAVWDVTLDATFKVAPGASKRLAWNAFARLVRSRREAIANGTFDHIPDPATPSLKDPRRAQLIFYDFSVKDDVYADTVSYSVSWIMYVNRSQAFAAAGLFVNPDPTNTWDQWASFNKSNKITDGRGLAQMRHLPGDDKLSTICEPGADYFETTESPQYPTDPNYDLLQDSTSDGTYLRYDVETQWLRDSQTNAHYPLQPESSPYIPDITYPDENAPPTSNRSQSPGVNNPPIIQRRSTGQYRIRFQGYAVRYGKPIPMPEINSASGLNIAAYEIGTPIFTQRPIRSTLSDKPLYLAQWSRTYVLEQLPTATTFLASNRQDPIVT